MKPHPFLRDLCDLTWPRARKPSQDQHEAREAVLTILRAAAGAYQFKGTREALDLLKRHYGITDAEVFGVEP
jgi:hypothetical protein